MNRVIGCLIILVATTVDYSASFKWIVAQVGDPIPKNAISVHPDSQVFVGRSRHYDEILPAEVNSTTAVVESCGKLVHKRIYEILVNRDSCYWEPYSNYESVPENIVHVGLNSLKEPIYIGRSAQQTHGQIKYRIQGLLLKSKTKNTWLSRNQNNQQNHVLVCESTDIWIDTKASKIPNNTIFGGTSKDQKEIYVARLKSGCAIIPGQVEPQLEIASSTYNGEKILAKYCQVLVGNTDDYAWVTSSSGEIPDYAVVSSRDKSGELMYVALIAQSLGYVTPSIAFNLNNTYDVLVRNG